MKKIALVTAGMMVFQITSLWAQEAPESSHTSIADSRNKFHAGLKAGLNSSRVYNTVGEDFLNDSKFGVTAGVFAAFPINKYWGFQPEIQFNQKGYSASGTTEEGSYSYTRNTGHVDVPLQLQVKPFRFMSIVAGPQFSFLVARQEIIHQGKITTVQEDEIHNSDLRKNTLGITGGLDIYYLKRFIISGRAGWDLQDNIGEGTALSPRYKNAWIQSTIGLRF